MTARRVAFAVVAVVASVWLRGYARKVNYRDPGGPARVIPAPDPSPSISRGDALAIRAMLAEGRYDSLATRLAWHADSARTDPEYESRYRAAFDVFEVADTTVGNQLDAWVTADATAGVARLARATHRLAGAWAARGHGWATDLTDGQVAGMRQWRDQAWTDLSAARDRDSTNVLVYFEMLDLIFGGRRQQSAESVLADGLRQWPGSLLLRARRMSMLRPRWGGTPRKMREFAYASERELARNPRLRLLHGYLDIDAADAGADSLLVPGCTAALTHGDHWEFRLRRADGYYFAKRYAEAAEDYSAVLLTRPADVEAIAWRAAAWDWLAFRMPEGPQQIALYARAKDEMRAAIALDAESPDVTRVLQTHPALRP